MKKIIILVSAISFFVLSAASYSASVQEISQQSNNQPSKSSKEQSNANNNFSNVLKSPVVQDIPHVQTQKTDTPKKQEYTWCNYFFDNITDWLIAAFTGLLALFSWLLWCTTKKTDQTSRLRDRAYLYLLPSVLPYPPGKVTHWGIGIVIENAGAMPAKNVKLKYAFADSEKIKWSQAGWQKLDSSITIGPKRTLPIQGKDILIATINKIKEGNAEVFIMAEVTYVDEFSPSKHHITQMRARLNVDIAGGYSFTFTPDHNCTDDDC